MLTPRSLATVILVSIVLSTIHTASATAGYCPIVLDYGERTAAVAMSARGDYVALGYNNYLYYHNLSEADPFWIYGNTSSPIFEVSISGDGRYLTMGGPGLLTVQLFGKAGNTPLWSFRPPHFPTPQEVGGFSLGYLSAVVSGDGRYVAAYAYWPQLQDTLYLFRTSSGVPLWSYDMPLPPLFAFPRVQISQNGGNVAIFNPATNDVSFFSERDNSSLWVAHFSTFTADFNVYHPMSWLSADGSYMAFSSGNVLDIFGKASNVTLETIEVTGPLESLEMSQDASTIATVDSSGALRVYDRSSGALLFTRGSLLQPDIALDRNGSRIISVGLQTVYNRTGQSICSLAGSGGPAAISADGYLIAAGSILYAVAPAPLSSSSFGFLTTWSLLAGSALGVYTGILGLSWVRWRMLERQSKGGLSTRNSDH